MPALRDLQLAFAATVLRREEQAAAGLLHPQDARLARRLMVYRVNARENFADARAAAFPVLRREMGDEEFRRMAWSYQRAHPSPSGNLFETGRRLPGYLDGALTSTADAYLRDVARLEWAVQDSLVAADCATRLDPRPLAALTPAAQADCRFTLHPSVRLLALKHRSPFDLWQALQAGDGAPQDDIASRRLRQPDLLLVWRTGEGIEIHRLDETTHACLTVLAAGRSLGAMTDAALARESGADVGGLLTRWAARGVITGIVTHAATSR